MFCIFNLWTVTCVLGQLMGGVLCANDFKQLHQVTELSGNDCLTSEEAFLATAPLGLLECVRMCVQTWFCQGIFYDEGSHLCHGCTKAYGASDEASLSVFVPTLSNAAYFSYPRQFIFGNSRYEIIESKMNYQKSGELCTAVGGYPVMIETEEENVYVKAFARTLHAGNVYIGLSQPGGAGTDWIWEATGAAMTFSDFHPLEPNGADEFCVVMYETISYQWADIGCNTQLSVVCEFLT